MSQLPIMATASSKVFRRLSGTRALTPSFLALVALGLAVVPGEVDGVGLRKSILRGMVQNRPVGNAHSRTSAVSTDLAALGKQLASVNLNDSMSLQALQQESQDASHMASTVMTNSSECGNHNISRSSDTGNKINTLAAGTEVAQYHYTVSRKLPGGHLEKPEPFWLTTREGKWSLAGLVTLLIASQIYKCYHLDQEQEEDRRRKREEEYGSGCCSSEGPTWREIALNSLIDAYYNSSSQSSDGYHAGKSYSENSHRDDEMHGNRNILNANMIASIANDSDTDSYQRLAKHTTNQVVAKQATNQYNSVRDTPMALETLERYQKAPTMWSGHRSCKSIEEGGAQENTLNALCFLSQEKNKYSIEGKRGGLFGNTEEVSGTRVVNKNESVRKQEGKQSGETGGKHRKAKVADDRNNDNNDATNFPHVATSSTQNTNLKTSTTPGDPPASNILKRATRSNLNGDIVTFI